MKTLPRKPHRMSVGDRIVVAGVAATWIAAIALCLFLAFHVKPAHAQITGAGCNNSVAISTGATVKAVADPSGNARTIVCGFDLIAGVAGTFQLQSGIGAACATGNRVMTGVFSLGVNIPIMDSSPVGRGLITDPGAGLCFVATGGPITGVLFYAQQ